MLDAMGKALFEPADERNLHAADKTNIVCCGEHGG